MNVIKIFLLVIFLLSGWPSYVERIKDLGLSFNGFLYVVIFLLIVSAVFSTAFMRLYSFRFLLAILLYFSSVLTSTYQKITSEVLTYDTFLTLYNSRGFAGEAIEEYKLIIVKSAAFGLLLLIGILLPTGRNKKPISWIFTYIPIFVIGLLTTMLFFRGGDGAKGLPTVLTPVAYFNLSVYEKLNNDYGERKEVSITTKGKNNKDIILIVDESISARYLDINSTSGEKTYLKEQFPNINIINFGIAAAATNCSYGTNIVLRYGGMRENYLEYISVMPSIWQYAKKAGYKTVFLDAQRDAGKYQNGMTDEEKEDIDEFVQYDKVPVLYRDMNIADSLIKYINNSTQEFIYVNKIGAHFPVNDRFPDNFIMHSPILDRGNSLDITDMPSREGYSNSEEHWRLYRNSYRNTILWNVGNFFNKIFNGANLNKSTIIYTSDHGQDLHEYSHTALSTHCNPNPINEEGAVPLVIVEGDSGSALKWESNLFSNKDKSSHYNIFPTLLKLMSYEDDKVLSSYGNSLDVPTNDPFTFNTRFFARLGKKPTWKKIEIDKLK